MDDIEQACEVCNGSGFKPDVLQYTVAGKNIADIMTLTIDEATEFFEGHDFVGHFKMLSQLGLNYLQLGQRLDTFSGGEIQRLKLSRELKGAKEILVLDEPSTGLHPADTEKLLQILDRLVEKGDTVIVIEHNLDIISQAGWIIDIRSGAGKHGGEPGFEGTVECLLKNNESDTSKYLRKHLAGN